MVAIAALIQATVRRQEFCFYDPHVGIRGLEYLDHLLLAFVVH